MIRYQLAMPCTPARSPRVAVKSAELSLPPSILGGAPTPAPGVGSSMLDRDDPARNGVLASNPPPPDASASHKRPRRVDPTPADDAVIVLDATPERDGEADVVGGHASTPPREGVGAWGARGARSPVTRRPRPIAPAASAHPAPPRAPRAVSSDAFSREVSEFILARHGAPPKRPFPPVFCRLPLDLRVVFEETTSRGGYEAVSRDKKWHAVCETLGLDLTGQTSASFQMRNAYERCLLSYELCGGDPNAPRDADAAMDALKAARGVLARSAPSGQNGRGAAPTRSRSVVKGGASSSFDAAAAEADRRRCSALIRVRKPPLVPVNPKPPAYSDEEEAEIARRVNLLPVPSGDEYDYLFPGANEADYVTVRNHVLARWRAEPNAFLPVETAASWFRHRQRPLAHCAHRFLTVHGFINFGVGFTSAYADPGSTRGTVAVVGAGLAGLSCARSLTQLGHRVVVLEARDRAGGRVWTKKLRGAVEGVEGDDEREGGGEKRGAKKTRWIEAGGEMGGSIITGSRGNPLRVIARQLDLECHEIRTDACPMYREGGGGRPIDEAIDDRVFQEYNGAALGAVNDLRTALGEAEAATRSLGEAIETARREKSLASDPSDRRLAGDLFQWHLANLEFAVASPLDDVSLGQWDQDDPYEFGGAHLWVPRGNGRLVAALARDLPVFYGRVAKTIRYPNAPNVTDSTETETSSRIDEKTGAFFMGDDEPRGETGGGDGEGEPASSGRLVSGGSVAIATAFADAPASGEEPGASSSDDGAFEIVYKREPEEGGVSDDADDDAEGRGNASESAPKREDSSGLSSSGACVVECANGETFVADAVVVTLPLGVLKRGSVAFDPPLPRRKLDAIANLGFGAMNKVVLLFERNFWDPDGTHDNFGYVNRSESAEADDPNASSGIARKRRGRCYTFYSYAAANGAGDDGSGAVLVALYAGDAAIEMEREREDAVVAGVVAALRDIFETGENPVKVPDPIDAACAMWGRDEFARGSYSNISRRGTGADYDAMARSVGERVFFAGEATNRMHPATMHGAYLSGAREAAKAHEALKRLGKEGKLRREFERASE